MGTQAVSRGAYSIKATAFSFNFLKTWPSFSRSESHCRFASIPGWGFLLRMIQHKCSWARFSAVRLMKSVSTKFPSLSVFCPGSMGSASWSVLKPVRHLSQLAGPRQTGIPRIPIVKDIGISMYCVSQFCR